MERQVLDWILQRVAMPKVHAPMIDIDCGRGVDLAELAIAFRAQGCQVETYGIEMNLQDTYEARKMLDHVLPGGYLQCEVSHNAFSFAYCHPKPTKRDSKQTSSFLDEFIFSREKDIFQRLTSYLQVGGIIVFRVTLERFNELANLIAFRLEDVHVGRVYRNEYTRAYGDPGWDVIFLGRKADPKVRSAMDRSTITSMKNRLIELAAQESLGLPPWDGEKLVAVRAPGPSIFRTSVIDPQALEEEMRSSRLWQDMEDWFSVRGQREHRPPLPLHLGHIGLLLSTGLLDGRVGNHLIKGRVVKRSRLTEDVDENGMEVRTESDRYSVEVRVLEANGAYFDLH